MEQIAPHEHSIGDLPIGNGPGKVPLSSSIRTGLIAVQSANSGAVASTAALTAFSGTGSYTLPANTLRANEVLRVSFLGTFGVTGTPTFLLSLSVGGVNRGATNPLVVNAAGNWSVDLEITQLASNAARMKAVFIIQSDTSIVGETVFYDVQGMDPTIDNIIVLSAQWGTSNPANTTTQVYRTVSREAIFNSAA